MRFGAFAFVLIAGVLFPMLLELAWKHFLPRFGSKALLSMLYLVLAAAFLAQITVYLASKCRPSRQSAILIAIDVAMLGILVPFYEPAPHWGSWEVAWALFRFGIIVFSVQALVGFVTIWLSHIDSDSVNASRLLFAGFSLGIVAGCLSYPILVGPYWTAREQTNAFRVAIAVLVAASLAFAYRRCQVRTTPQATTSLRFSIIALWFGLPAFAALHRTVWFLVFNGSPAIADGMPILLAILGALSFIPVAIAFPGRDRTGRIVAELSLQCAFLFFGLLYTFAPDDDPIWFTTVLLVFSVNWTCYRILAAITPSKEHLPLFQLLFAMCRPI